MQTPPPEHASDLHEKHADDDTRHVVSVREILQRGKPEWQIVGFERASHHIGTQGILDVMSHVRNEMDIEPCINADRAIRARIVYDTQTGEVVEAEEEADD